MESGKKPLTVAAKDATITANKSDEERRRHYSVGWPHAVALAGIVPVAYLLGRAAKALYCVLERELIKCVNSHQHTHQSQTHEQSLTCMLRRVLRRI